MMLRHDYTVRLAQLGFSELEVNAVTLVLVRMGVQVPGVTEKPKFVHWVNLDDDEAINEARWRKGMLESGFYESSILVARYALGFSEGAE